MSPSKEDVLGFIKSNGPVSRKEIVEHWDGFCDCCGDEKDIANTIDEYRIQLLDEGKIIADATWNYRYSDK